jgi:putative peptide zinc metalloprotease protein
VFPFDRPLPAGDGDNQALAVNTEDGSVLYDVSFALVWADGDTALNRNEAYALASCEGCTTVAVAFQVVLLVGQVDVVVPQNIAAAVNYACVECVTAALATQLVVSLDGPLDADGQRELAQIWAELQELAGAVPTLPLAELRDRLAEYEARIVDVVRANGEPVTTADEAEQTAGSSEAPGEPAATSEAGAATGGAGDGTTDGTSGGAGTDTGTGTGGEEPADSTSTPTGGAGEGTSGTTSSGSSAPPSSAPATSPEPAAGSSPPAATAPSGSTTGG